jgi:hypothetical protein
VGFPRRDLTKLAVALKHTFALVWVRSTRQSRFAKLGQVLGFDRATSDGVFCAVIWDVAVRLLLPFSATASLVRSLQP